MSKNSAQSAADQEDLKRIVETILSVPAGMDPVETPSTPDPDAQEYKMHLEIGDSTVFLKNTDPKTLVASLRQKLRQSDQKLSIVVRHKKNAEPAGPTASIEFEQLKQKLLAAEAKLQQVQVQRAEQTGPGSADVEHQLRKAKKKLLITLRQKENLTGTCEDQANYIAELTQKLDSLQSLRSQIEAEMQILRAQQVKSEQDRQQYDQLGRQLAQAQQTIGQLETALHQKEQSLKESSGDAAQQLTQYQRTIEELQNALAESRSQLEQRIASTAQYEADAHALKEQISSLEARLNQLSVEKEFLQAQLAKFEESDSRYHAAMEENRKLQEQINALRTQLEGLTHQLEQTTADWRQSLDKTTGLSEELRLERELTGTLTSQVKEAKDTLARTQQQLEEQGQRGGHLQDELDALTSRFKQAQEALETATRQSDRSEQERSGLQNELNELNVRLTQSQEALNVAQQQCSSGEQERSRLVEEINQLRTQITQTQDSVAETQRQLAENQQAREHLQNDLAELTRHKQSLEEQIGSQAAALGDSKQKHAELLEQNRILEETITFHLKELDTRDHELSETYMRLEQAGQHCTSLEQQTAALSADKQLLAEKLAQLQSTLSQSQLTVQSLEADKAAVEQNLAAASATLVSLEQDKAQLTLQFEQAARERKSLEDEKNRFETEMTERQTALESEIAVRKEEIGSLKNGLARLGEERTAHLEQIADLRESETLYRAKSSELEVELQTAKNELQSTQHELELAEKLNLEKSQYQTVLEGELAQKEELIAQLRRRENELGGQLQDAGQALDAAAAKRRELEAELSRNQAELLQTNSQLSQAQDALVGSEDALQRLQGEHESIQQELATRNSECERISAELSETKQDLDITEQTLAALQAEYRLAQHGLAEKQSELEQTGATLEETRKNLTATGQSLETLRAEYNNLKETMRLQAQEHHNQLQEKDRTIQSLRNELKETTDCVNEFERLIQQVDAENAELRVNIEKTSERILLIQEETTRQTELNEQLQRQVDEMKHSVAIANETEEALRQTKQQIRSLEQTIAQEKDSHEATQRQLSRQKAACADLTEKMQNQALEINRLQDQMKEILENRKLVETNLAGLAADPLKRKVMEMAAKIESLNLLLHERTNCLKQAQKQIQQQGTHAAANPSETKHAETPDKKPLPSKQPESLPAAAGGGAVEVSPLSAGTSKAHDSIRKLRDELAQRRDESQQSHEKLTRAAEELETLKAGSEQAPPKRSFQHKLDIFKRRS